MLAWADYAVQAERGNIMGSHATRRETPGHSLLGSMSHCGLILASKTRNWCSLTDRIVGGTRGTTFRLFLREAIMSSSGMSRRRPPPGCHKGGFGDAVVARGMPEPREFPSLDSCQKKFLWANKVVDLAQHQVVGLVLQGGNAEKFSSGNWFRKPGSFSQSQQTGCMSHNQRGGWR